MRNIPAETITKTCALIRGSTFDLSWTWKQNGTAVTTSGGTCEATFRPVFDGGNLLVANAGNGKLTVGAAGVFTWSLSPADIATLGDAGVYDVKFTESGGDVRSVVHGTYTVIDEI